MSTPISSRPASASAVSRHTHWIGGEPFEPVAPRWRDIRNPADDTTIATVADAGAGEVDRAVRAARAALARWRGRTPGERSNVLLELADLVADHREELALIESRNAGKPLSLAREELPVCVDNLRFFAAAARCLDGRPAGEYLAGYTSMIRREAIGVVGQITPWNYPLMMAIWKLGPALAAGNTIVLKPSELTPLSTLRLVELAREILPPGVVNVVCGDEVAGAAIVEHPQVRMISLTGSVQTGKAVAARAAGTLKRVHLELGGKAPMIVFGDADPAAVARGARVGAFMNSGQDCTAVSRILVAERAYDEVLAALVDATSSLVVGDPAKGEAIEMGPVISAAQRAAVLGYIKRAASTAEVLCGGYAPAGAGYFVAPTVIAGVDQRDEIVQDEVFGPVLTVQRFASEVEAIALANDVRYGLAASVWTASIDRAMRAAAELEFGTVWINDHIPFLSEMPHGGFKESGYGKDMSIYAVEEYTDIKHVMVRHGQAREAC